MSGAAYTFRSNRTAGRHGWLRLTPAYSKRAVDEILDGLDAPGVVLDPFCGTGTTALACAERGIPTITVEINPFLVWFSRVKTDVYSRGDVEDACAVAATRLPEWSGEWMPDISNIDRWWSPETARQLAVIRQAIGQADVSERSRALLLVGFCRTMIGVSSASFRHQSMSFARLHDISHATITHEKASIPAHFLKAVAEIADSALLDQPVVIPDVAQGDARYLGTVLGSRNMPVSQTVITSPPYPNRMSYVRELRPYMYWLGYLSSGAEAGELDWRAIGGTWGKATSNLARWRAGEALPEHLAFLEPVLADIGKRSTLLARYVERYVEDMSTHIRSVLDVTSPGATCAYIVGNSRFYEVMVDTERILAAIFASHRMSDIGIRTLRKRTSKRELWEYVVTARTPMQIDPLVV